MIEFGQTSSKLIDQSNPPFLHNNSAIGKTSNLKEHVPNSLHQQAQQQLLARQAKSKKLAVCDWVIDPSGWIYHQWSLVVSLAFLYNFWALSYRFAFCEINDDTLISWFALDYSADFIYLLDILINHHIGYLEDGVLERNRDRISAHYRESTLFYLDCFCLLPLDFLYLSIGYNSVLRISRLVKIYKFWSCVDRTERHTNYPNVFRTFTLVHYILVILHWNSCIFHMVSKNKLIDIENLYKFNSDNRRCDDIQCQYLHAFYWSTLAITTIGDLPRPSTKGEYFYVIVELLFGIFLFASILGHVANIVTNVSAARREFQAKLDSVKTFMRQRRVSEELQKKVIRWFDYLWTSQQSSDEDKSVACLPDRLKAEIAIHVHLDTLKRVDIFQNTEAGFLCELVLRLKPVLFSPGDFVCRKNEVGLEMYIVSRGILEVLTDDTMTVVATLRAGSYFGEISVLNVGLEGNRRTASVRSVGYSDLFCLNKQDLWDVLKNHPNAEARIRARAEERLFKLANQKQQQQLSQQQRSLSMVNKNCNNNHDTSNDNNATVTTHNLTNSSFHSKNGAAHATYSDNSRNAVLQPHNGLLSPADAEAEADDDADGGSFGALQGIKAPVTTTTTMNHHNKLHTNNKNHRQKNSSSFHELTTACGRSALMASRRLFVARNDHGANNARMRCSCCSLLPHNSHNIGNGNNDASSNNHERHHRQYAYRRSDMASLRSLPQKHRDHPQPGPATKTSIATTATRKRQQRSLDSSANMILAVSSSCQSNCSNNNDCARHQHPQQVYPCPLLLEPDVHRRSMRDELASCDDKQLQFDRPITPTNDNVRILTINSNQQGKNESDCSSWGSTPSFDDENEHITRKNCHTIDMTNFDHHQCGIHRELATDRAPDPCFGLHEGHQLAPGSLRNKGPRHCELCYPNSSGRHSSIDNKTRMKTSLCNHRHYSSQIQHHKHQQHDNHHTNWGISIDDDPRLFHKSSIHSANARFLTSSPRPDKSATLSSTTSANMNTNTNTNKQLVGHISPDNSITSLSAIRQPVEQTTRHLSDTSFTKTINNEFNQQLPIISYSPGIATKEEDPDVNDQSSSKQLAQHQPDPHLRRSPLSSRNTARTELLATPLDGHQQSISMGHLRTVGDIPESSDTVIDLDGASRCNVSKTMVLDDGNIKDSIQIDDVETSQLAQLDKNHNPEPGRKDDGGLL